MGASSSIVCGEYLSKEDLILIFKDSFNEDLYNKLKNEEGLVKIQQINEIIEINNNNIKLQKLLEIQKQFKLYCPNNKMNSRNFIQYLRDAKLLNKNKFNIIDTEILFDKIKSNQNIISNTLDCPTFINSLNIIAERIGIDRDTLITKLSKVEYEPDTKCKSVRSNDNNDNHTNNTTHTTSTSTPNDEKSAAAIKLQTLSRERAAKKQVAELREVSIVSCYLIFIIYLYYFLFYLKFIFCFQ